MLYHPNYKDTNYTKVISAGIIVFRWTAKEPLFLLLYRDRGAWDFPRGRMESGERSWETAFREVEEETGLKAQELKIQSNFKVYEKFPYRRKEVSGKIEQIFKIVIFYLAETKQSQVVLSDEHKGYGWFSHNEARRLLSRYKARVVILKKALEYMKGINRS